MTRAWSVCAVSLLSLLASCSFLRPANTPMERVAFRKQGASTARGAIVLMPGFGDRPTAFDSQGFVAALAQKAPGYDVYAADAHFGYYRKRTLIDRLEHDVVGPLKKLGYRELWLMGASLGGFGAVAYARTHPENIRGVMLFAPYLGPSGVVKEVSATGLCKYARKPAIEDSEEEFARANFAWLRRQACDERAVSLFIAVGDSDHLLRADKLVGDVLDPTHMLVLPGGHGWKVWTPAVERLAPLAFDTKGASD